MNKYLSVALLFLLPPYMAGCAKKPEPIRTSICESDVQAYWHTQMGSETHRHNAQSEQGFAMWKEHLQTNVNINDIDACVNALRETKKKIEAGQEKNESKVDVE